MALTPFPPAPVKEIISNTSPSWVSWFQNIYSSITNNRKITVNVLDYGIKGNGNNDDTALIQKAANDAQGSTLLFPAVPSKYVLSSSVSLPNNCRIIGVGWPNIYQSTPNSAGLIPGNNNEIAFLYFSGTGNYTNPGRGVIYNDPGNTGTIGQKIKIHHNQFDSSISTSCISGNNWIDCEIKHNIINQGVQTEHGIYISGGSTRTRVKNNYISRTGIPAVTSVRGIQVKGSSILYIDDNIITGTFNGYGIISSDVASNNLFIRGNRIFSLGSGTIGIKTGANSGDTDIHIENNKLDSTGDYGIVATSDATGGNTIKIKYNTVKNCAAKGIYLDGSVGTMTSLFVDDNTVINNTGDGINATSTGDDLYIRNNFVKGSTASAGIYVNGSTKGLVAYNTTIGYGTPLSLITAIPRIDNQTSNTSNPV